MRIKARATKKGPAAPVILFPHRSRVLKQPNTHFAQIIWQPILHRERRAHKLH